MADDNKSRDPDSKWNLLVEVETFVEYVSCRSIKIKVVLTERKKWGLLVLVNKGQDNCRNNPSFLF